MLLLGETPDNCWTLAKWDCFSLVPWTSFLLYLEKCLREKLSRGQKESQKLLEKHSRFGNSRKISRDKLSQMKDNLVKKKHLTFDLLHIVEKCLSSSSPNQDYLSSFLVNDNSPDFSLTGQGEVRGIIIFIIGELSYSSSDEYFPRLRFF